MALRRSQAAELVGVRPPAAKVPRSLPFLPLDFSGAVRGVKATWAGAIRPSRGAAGQACIVGEARTACGRLGPSVMVCGMQGATSPLRGKRCGRHVGIRAADSTGASATRQSVSRDRGSGVRPFLQVRACSCLCAGAYPMPSRCDARELRYWW